MAAAAGSNAQYLRQFTELVGLDLRSGEEIKTKGKCPPFGSLAVSGVVGAGLFWRMGIGMGDDDGIFGSRSCGSSMVVASGLMLSGACDRRSTKLGLVGLVDLAPVWSLDIRRRLSGRETVGDSVDFLKLPDLDNSGGRVRLAEGGNFDGNDEAMLW